MFGPGLKFSFIFIILNCLNCNNFIEVSSLYKYEVIVDYIGFPESRQDKLFDYGTLRVKKLDRTTYGIDGYFDLLRDITDHLEATYEIYTLQGNEYRRTTDKKHLTKVCSTSQEKRHYVADYFKFTDIPPDYECPFSSGRYNVNNLSFPNEYLPFDPPRGEKFRVNVTFNLGQMELSRYSIYAILKKNIPTWT